MLANNTAIRLLGIPHPLVQGPFGGGLSTLELTATVSRLGGLGSYGAHGLEPEAIAPLVADLRARTSAPFAINLWVSDHDAGGLHLTRAQFDAVYAQFEPWFRELELPKPEMPERYHPSFERQVEALLEARPPVFSFVFGIPDAKILRACRARQMLSIGAATSIAEALALDEAGVDLIVASGAEAGGHRPSFLRRAEDSLMGSFALVQLLAARVRAPVIAAGGIVDAKGVRAMLTLGAQAAQLGTAFLACAESGAHELHRKQLFAAAAQDTVLTRGFTGRLARGIRNRWTDSLRDSAAVAPFPVQGWFVARLRAAALQRGHSDLVSLWSGQIAPNLRHRRAADLMDALINE